jgi:sulfite reductase (NADPH) hemoprotein beta-component
MSASSAVARIAYLSSDVLVQQFAETYPSLTQHTPKLLTVPIGADPGATIVSNSDANLVSFIASSNAHLFASLLLHLNEISALPVVLHLALENDLTDALLLRPVAPFFLLSTTAQQAHDNALLASRLARVEQKAVVHAFYTSSRDPTLTEVSEGDILPFLLSGQHPIAPSLNGHSNSVDPPSFDDPTLLALSKAYESVALDTLSLIRRPLRPVTSQGSSQPHTVIFILGLTPPLPKVDGVLFVTVSLINPLLPSRILNAISASVKHIIVLEQVHRWTTKWLPFYLDVVSALHQRDSEYRPSVHSVALGDLIDLKSMDILKLIECALSTPPSVCFELGVAPDSGRAGLEVPHAPKHELAYTKILSHLFNDRLEISNSPSLVPSQGKMATSPEYALGRVRGQLELRADLVNAVQELSECGNVNSHLHSLLTNWTLARDDASKSKIFGKQIMESLESSPVDHRAAKRILALRALFPAMSRWIIGSDAWSYDLGSSGLHHAIASGLDINILILDTLPFSARNSADPYRRKRDVGLYAMNHGDVYVASVAVFSSYSQVLQAFVEADRFNGPSVVVAYLPYQSEDVPVLEVLKETKLAVDSGYWPLYRWNPAKEQEGKEPFSLDSDAVKRDLQQFLDRQNHLSQLVRSKPQIAGELVNSLGEKLKEARKQRAQHAYDELITALDAPPLLILYASDGGNAEKTAKKLANRAKARGLSATITTMDSVNLDALAQEEYVVFITSVAGQGEPPQNGRAFFKALNAAAARGEQILPKLRYSVFGMGDSHYWPRPEDAHYYNKPGKDLDARLEKLGGVRIASLGLGDDQDADGPQTGYKIWEPLLWKAFGVESVEVTEAEPESITNEHIKAASGFLRGTIAEGLEDTSTGALAASDTQLTKFHGIYQQDDRDIRDERQAQGVEPAYSFMIRVRMPGGVCLPHQWLQMDQIADEHGSGTFKITTRQTFQFHGVIKRHLKPAIQDINQVLLDTLAACGDVNRCDLSLEHYTPITYWFVQERSLLIYTHQVQTTPRSLPIFQGSQRASYS